MRGEGPGLRFGFASRDGSVLSLRVLVRSSIT